MKIFAWMKQEQRKHPCVHVCVCVCLYECVCVLYDTQGKSDFISKDKESVCFLQLHQESGGLPLTGPGTVPVDLPQPSQFSCAFVGSFPQISRPQLHDFILPSSCPFYPHFYTSPIAAHRPWLHGCSLGCSPLPRPLTSLEQPAVDSTTKKCMERSYM